MSFTFEVSHVTTLPKARVCVLDGRLLDGHVTTGSMATLVHGDQSFSLRVKGVGMVQPNVLSLTVDLRQPGMNSVAVGDRVVCA